MHLCEINEATRLAALDHSESQRLRAALPALGASLTYAKRPDAQFQEALETLVALVDLVAEEYGVSSEKLMAAYGAQRGAGGSLAAH